MGELRMSNKERVTLDAMSRVKRKELTVVAVAGLMGLSVRQARRVWKRFPAEGDEGLVHKLRGRASNRRLSEDVRERAVKPHQEKYHDFGATLSTAVQGCTCRSLRPSRKDSAIARSSSEACPRTSASTRHASRCAANIMTRLISGPMDGPP
jgi:hypothetical protein